MQKFRARIPIKTPNGTIQAGAEAIDQGGSVFLFQTSADPVRYYPIRKSTVIWNYLAFSFSIEFKSDRTNA